MSGWLGFLWLLFLFNSGGWLLAAVVSPVLLSMLPDRLSAPALKRSLWLIALLPLLLPVCITGSILALAVAKARGWISDHCLFHAPHHPHFCFEHLPQIHLSEWHALGVSLMIGLLAVFTIRLLLGERRRAAKVAALNAFSRSRGRLKKLDSHQVLGFAAGLKNPGVFLSEGLLKTLDKRQRRIVVAHEVAHIRHRDLWSSVLFELLLLLQWPATAKSLRTCWLQALEELADERVARRYGRTEVAATLLALTRATSTPSPMPLSVAGADTRQRIERLLDTRELRRVPLFEVGYCAALLIVACAIIVSHHSFETLLGMVAGH